MKVVAYDPRAHRQTTGLDFFVNRPAEEPGFYLERTEANDRHIQYTMHAYVADRPHGERYGSDGKSNGKGNGSK